MSITTQLITNANIDINLKQVVNISEIENQCFYDPWQIDSIKDTMKYSYNHILVALQNQEVVGYVIFSIVDEQCELLRIAVSQKHRQQGLAELLMKEFMIEAIRNQAQVFLLEVREGNVPAISLYNKMGFKKIHTRKNYYTNPVEDGCIFQRFS